MSYEIISHYIVRPLFDEGPEGTDYKGVQNEEVYHNDRYPLPAPQLCRLPEPSITDLAAVTGGRERIVLDDIWKELPPKHRFFDMTPILAILAMLCLLLSKLPVFIRRKRPAMAPPAVQRPVQQTAQAVVTEKPKHAEKHPQPSQPEEKTATQPAPSEPPSESSASISDALKRVRKR